MEVDGIRWNLLNLAGNCCNSQDSIGMPWNSLNLNGRTSASQSCSPGHKQKKCELLCPTPQLHGKTNERSVFEAWGTNNQFGLGLSPRWPQKLSQICEYCTKVIAIHLKPINFNASGKHLTFILVLSKTVKRPK